MNLTTHLISCILNIIDYWRIILAFCKWKQKKNPLVTNYTSNNKRFKCFFNLDVIIIKLLTKLGSSSSTWTSSSEPESDTQSNCKSGAERTSLAVDVVWSSCQNKCHVNKLINISILLVISFQYLSST